MMRVRMRIRRRMRMGMRLNHLGRDGPEVG